MMGTNPLAQLLAALILLCGVALLVRRRLGPQITLVQVQACALAAAAAWAAITQRAPQLLLASVLILALQGLLLPAMLRRIAPKFGSSGTPLPSLALPLGLFLLVLALLLAPLALAVPLAVILLGLLALVLRHDPLAQTIGLFSAEAGLMLAAINLPGLPIALFALGVLALPAAVLAGVVRFRPGSDLATLETPATESRKAEMGS